MAAVAEGQRFTCVATGCGKRYDPSKTRAHLRGLCSQACQDALAKELGWRRAVRGRPTQYSVIKHELHRRRATVPGADTRDIVAVIPPDPPRQPATPELRAVIGPGMFEIVDPVRAQQLAEAFVLVARANHYMVGIVAAYSGDELDAAERRLITQENAEPNLRHVTSALDIVQQAKRDLQRAGAAPFAGVEPYYARLFREIRERHDPQGTGGDLSCLMAMVEWLRERHPRLVPGCPGCGTHDHAHSVDKHKASGIPMPQHAGQHWNGAQWVTP